MSDISLSAAARTSLLDLQRTDQVRARSSDRLASGRQINRVTDDPVGFSQSAASRKRVSDLLYLKNDTGQALSAVETALNGVKTIEKLTQQLRGLAVSAQNASGSQRAEIAKQFDAIRTQITAVAADTSYGGVSLISSVPGSIDQQVGDISKGFVSVPGKATDAAALGVGSASATYNGFATNADISAAISGLDTAVSTLRTTASQFGSKVASLTISEKFNQSLSQTLQAGQDKRVNADLNQEAANLLSTRVRAQLGQEGLRIAQQGGTAVSQLLQSVIG